MDLRKVGKSEESVQSLKKRTMLEVNEQVCP